LVPSDVRGLGEYKFVEVRLAEGDALKILSCKGKGTLLGF
jgi:hypothetical protein